MKNKSEVYTTGDVANVCGVTLRTVINWINQGKLKAHKLPGPRGDNRIVKADLLAFMDRYAMPIPESMAQNSELADESERCQDSILVVDDDVNMAKAIYRLLRRSGKQVFIAHNGFEAGLLYAEKQPVLMTLDLQMPKMDGFEVLDVIKKNKKGKIIVISAMPDHELKRALDHGADAVLAKPFDDRELLKIVDEYSYNR